MNKMFLKIPPKISQDVDDKLGVQSNNVFYSVSSDALHKEELFEIPGQYFISDSEFIFT